MDAEAKKNESDFLIDELLGEGPPQDPLESEHLPAARTHRLSARLRHERVLKKQALLNIIPEPPALGEAIHVLSDATFDFWTWVPAMLEWVGRTEVFWCSTWTVSRPNVVDLLSLWDAGRIGTVNFLTGLYFKRRETAVYAMLLEGIRMRGGRYRASRNHAKVLLLEGSDGTRLTVEGSANLTSNPRTEQYVIVNDPDLHAWHAKWMEECLTK